MAVGPSACKVYDLTKQAKFARDFGLKGQIQDAAGTVVTLLKKSG